MAFRARDIIPSAAYVGAKNAAISVADLASNYKQEFTTGTSAENLIQCLRPLISYRAQLNGARSVPGIGAYAQAQQNDPGYDVAAEFNALIAVIDDAISWLITSFPRDGSDYLLIYKMNAANGRLEARTFNAAQTAPFLIKLQAIVDAVS